MKIFSSLDLSVKFKVWRGVHRIKCVILEFCVITCAFILYTESNPWTQRAHAHSTRLLFRGDPPAALDDVCFLGAVGELVLQRSVFLVFIVTFQVISERNEMDIVALKSLQTATLTVWRGLFWLYNTLITPLCYLWRLFPCTHLQNCLSDGFFFHFFFFLSAVISHNNNKVVIDSLSFVLYKLPSKVTVIALCCVMQMKVCGNMHFHRATFMPEI